MQIDFHHAVTYVCCRLGGLGHDDASVVSHAAQYVDDATHDGPLHFSNGARYVRTTSAHRSLDIWKNKDEADNRLVWVPFHFLPGNQVLEPGKSEQDQYIERMVCRPDSLIANEMMKDCIENQQHAFALHRLGIGLHTFVDTWAHQGFVGIICDFNRVDSVTIEPIEAYKDADVFRDLNSGTTKITAFVAGHLPVGHAGVVTFPDLPFAKWRFKRVNGEVVTRDNPLDFLSAATRMYNMVRRYVAGQFDLPDQPLPASDQSAIEDLLRNTLFIDGEDRHSVWLKAIENGRFSFGSELVTYEAHGLQSWKYAALGDDPDDESSDTTYTYRDSFTTSNWKYFHDAVQYHRLFILHELLPRHDLVAS